MARPPEPTPRDRARLIRLGLPPAVSLAVHALLLGLIILIGVGIEHAPGPRPRLAEIASEPGPATNSPDPAPELAAPRPNVRPAAATSPTPAERTPESFASAPAGPDSRALGSLPASTLGASPASLTDPASARTPTASFAGLKSQAAGRIVYVVDASGAVVPTLTYIKRRLAQSIDRLAPTQRFDIIFFREPAPGADDLEPRPRFAGELVPATAQTRADAVAWIDTVNAAGRSDPGVALEEALALKPDLVFLLSTSIQRTQTDAGAERTRLLTLLDTLNPENPRIGQRPVVIKALQFLRPDPANLLRDIAFLHGDGEGSYRLLTATQLDAADPEETPAQTDPTNPFTTQAARRLADLEAAAWPVVLGLPTRAERTHVRQTSGNILDALDRVPDAARDTRWKLLHQRATLFFAASREGGPDRELLARAAAESVRGVLTEPEADLERRLVRALTEGLSARPDAKTPSVARLTRIDEEATVGGFVNVATRARIGAIVCGGEVDGENTIASMPRDSRALLLLAEAWSRSRLTTDPRDPDGLLPLIIIERTGLLHPSPEVSRSLVWGRIAAASDSFAVDWEQVPAPVALARAAVLAQTAATQAEGLAALEAVTDRDDAHDETRAEALWQGAIAERDRAQTDDAALARVGARLRQLVERFPETPHARDAAAAALALGTSDSGVLPDSTPSEFVTLALETFPEHAAADRWRLGLAHRARGLPRLDILEQIPPGSPEESDAAALYLRTVNELAAQPDTLSVLERALTYTHARGRVEWYALALRTAETGESADPARSAELYLALAGAPTDDLQDAGVALSPDELCLLAGRAMLASGKTAVGVRLLTDLAARLEATGDRGPIFWRAWAMVLETLAESTDPAARAAALAHASRLRLIDAAMGGGESGRRILDAVHRLDSAHEHDPAHGSADPG